MSGDNEIRFMSCGHWYPHDKHKGCLGVRDDDPLGALMRGKPPSRDTETVNKVRSDNGVDDAPDAE